LPAEIIKFAYNIGSLHAQNSEISQRQGVFTLSGRTEAEDVKELGQLLALGTAGNSWCWI